MKIGMRQKNKVTKEKKKFKRFVFAFFFSHFFTAISSNKQQEGHDLVYKEDHLLANCWSRRTDVKPIKDECVGEDESSGQNTCAVCQVSPQYRIYSISDLFRKLEWILHGDMFTGSRQTSRYKKTPFTAQSSLKCSLKRTRFRLGFIIAVVCEVVWILAGHNRPASDQ